MSFLIVFELEELTPLMVNTILIDAENEREARNRFVNMLTSLGSNATIIEIRPINNLSDLIR